MRWLALACLFGACATAGAPPTPDPLALTTEPLPWPARVQDLRWLEGRWLGRDASGACRLEHWLLGDDAATLVRDDGQALEVLRVTAADLGARGEREVVVGPWRYRRDGETLEISGATSWRLTRQGGLATGCR